MAELVEVRARIEEDLHRRFVQVLPGFGGLAWFIREAMEQFVNEMENNPTMAEAVARSVRRLGS